MKESKIKNIDLLKLPFPLAEACRLYTNISEDNYSEKISRAKEIYEILAKLLSSLTIKCYLTISDSYSDENKKELKTKKNIHQKLEGINRPSLGHWTGFLRDILSYFSKKDEIPSEILKQTISYYHAKLPGDETGEVYQAVEILANYLNQKIQKPSNEMLFDFFVTVRNRLASGGHGASLTDTDNEKISNALECILAHLLSTASVIHNFKLLYIEKVIKIKGEIIYEVKTCSSILVARDRFAHNGDPANTLMDGELYFCATSQEDEAKLPKIDEAISLSPFSIYTVCSETKTEQVFFFNGIRGKTLEYLNYSTGSYYWPQELEQEIKDIIDVAKGNKIAAEIFKPIKNFEQKTPTIEERKRADQLAINCIELLREDLFEQSLKQAEDSLKLNPFNAAAHYAKGLTWCYLGKPLGALSSFKEASKNSPDDTNNLLGISLILFLLGDKELSVSYLQKIKKADSSHQLANQLIESPDDFDDIIFERNDCISKEEKTKLIANTILNQKLNTEVEIVSWFYAIPPWSWIYKLISARYISIPPLTSSILFSLFIYIIFFIFHHKAFAFWGFFSSESITLYARFGIIAALITCGLYYPFAFSQILKTSYGNLKKIILIPNTAFRNWYLSEVATFWGSINLNQEYLTNPKKAYWDQRFIVKKRFIDSLEKIIGKSSFDLIKENPFIKNSQIISFTDIDTAVTESDPVLREQNNSAISSDNPVQVGDIINSSAKVEIEQEREKIRQAAVSTFSQRENLLHKLFLKFPSLSLVPFTWRYEKKIIILYLILVILSIPAQYYNSGDSFPPSIVPSSFYNQEYLNPPLNSPVPPVGFIQSLIAFFIRHFIYYFEVFLVAWGLTFIFPALKIVKSILKLPVRYFISIPKSLTLNPLSKMFLNFSLLAAVVCYLTFLQLFIFRCYSFAPIACFFYVILGSIGFLSWILIPQFLIISSMQKLRDLKLEEYSFNIERAYNLFLKESTKRNYEELKEKDEFSKRIKKNLPSSPFTYKDIIVLCSLIFSIVGITVLYFISVVVYDLPNLNF